MQRLNSVKRYVPNCGDDIEFIEFSIGDRIRAWFIRDIMRLKDSDVKQLWSACKGIEEDRRERKAGK